MRLMIQRVEAASVLVDDRLVGKIENGLLVFVGIGSEDTEQIADSYIDKLIKLRIFADDNGKTNLSLVDVDGGLLVVSQFTLYADCKKGNRPNFIQAALPERAKYLYEYFVAECKKRLGQVETGEFGADMKVNITNDGPFTIMLDENILKK